MIQQLLPIVCVGLVAMGIAWALIGRVVKQRRWLRLVLRVAATVGIVAVMGVVIPGIATSPAGVPSGDFAAAALQNQTPIDSSVVEEGSLTITLNATGSLSPLDQIELAFELSDPVAQVLVTEGQRVEAGDILAVLDPTDAEAAVRDAEIALAEAQATYDQLLEPPRDVDVAVAEAQVLLAQASLYSASLTAPDATDEEIARLNAEIARNQLWQSQLNRDIVQALNPEFRTGSGGANAQDIHQDSQVESQEYNVEIEESNYNETLNEGPSAGTLASANAALVEAQANLDDLLNPADAAEVRRVEIDVETAQLDLERAQEQLTRTTLTAPIAGLVADEDLTVGEVPPNSDVITLIDDSVYTIDLAIDETDVVNVEVGQPVTLSVDALPGIDFTGMVTKVDSAPTIDGQLVTYLATVTLDPTQEPLRPGMSATATITIRDLENVITVPNRYIRVDGNTQRTFIVVEENGRYREATVVIGARNEAQSQIVSGLEAGQTIVLLPTQSQSPEDFGQPPPESGGATGGG